MRFVKCSYIHCKSRNPGIFTPIIRFYAKGAKEIMPPGHAIVSGILLCQNCANTAKVHDIVSDKRWIEICDTLAKAGATPPDRDSIELLLGRPNKKEENEKAN